MIRKRTKIFYKRSCNTIIKALAHHVPITLHMLRSHTSYCGMIMWATDKKLLEIYETKLDVALEFGVEAI